MTRTIHFRAWDKQESKWLEGSTAEIVAHGGNTERFALMQFTGLLDKNGREIYEGDILKWTHPDFKELKQEYKILEMSDIRKSLMLEPDCRNGWIEIIGNVWENPELLPTP